MSENTKIDVLEAIGTAAAKEAENIIASAETYAEERRSAAMQNAYELGEAEEKKANERADDILKKRATAARMERNKIILDAKRKAVDRVYELLLDGLKKLNEDEFVNLVSIAVEKYGEDGQKILLSASAPAKKEKIESLAAVKNKSMIVETADGLRDGFAISGEIFDRDFSYASIAQSCRERTENEVAAKLLR